MQGHTGPCCFAMQAQSLGTGISAKATDSNLQVSAASKVRWHVNAVMQECQQAAIPFHVSMSTLTAAELPGMVRQAMRRSTCGRK